VSPKPELTRAEIVRLRRRQQNASRMMAQSFERAVRPLPPVTSREGLRSGATKQKRPSTKRRFQASLSMPGIQLRGPSITLPAVSIGGRLLSLGISLLLGALLYLAWTLPMFRVAGVQVAGNQRVGADEINAVLNSAGQPIFMLRPAELETRLRLNYPELASVRVRLGLPNVVSVELTERQPVILWQQGGGFTWIDEKGVAFRPRGAADGLIPVVALAAPAAGQPSANDPLSPVPFISAEIVKAVKTLAPSAPSGTPLLYDPRSGLGWADSRGWQVFFGSDGQDTALKLQVYQSLVTSLAGRGTYPVFISVQYPSAPFYRMSQ
jgi:cell division protein FtsQ